MNVPDKVNCECMYPTIAVPNLLPTVEFYRDKLEFDVQFLWGEPPVHAGLEFGNATLHLNEQADADPKSTTAGCWIYFQVDDVDDLHERYLSNSVNVVEAPTTKEWGMREISIDDNNGFRLRFGQVDFSQGEPIPVERVEIKPRVEKRMAALLQDLATHKQMTIGELLEETFLHTFETIDGLAGKSVASPHTQRTMRFIDTMKLKHGIDYETHDAYRFKE